MTFEDSVEKNLSRCLAAAGVTADYVVDQAMGQPLGPAAGSLVRGYDGVSLLVGLSGGIDSTALLLALKKISQNSRSQSTNPGASLGLDLHACHVNHNLRGAEGAADQEFCRQLCEKLDVPLIVVDLTPTTDGEAELRAARYEKLIRVARQQAAPYIVTAHNLDDQVETLIFRLLRGTSLRGLVGMARARALDSAPWPILLRPLLDLSRADVERYLAEQGVCGRLDTSNNDVKYSRNFLRSQIIAPLKQRFPGLVSNIEHFRLTLQTENDYMARQAGLLFNRALSAPNKLLLSVLDGEHPALIGRVVTTYMEQAGIEASFQRVNLIVDLIERANASSDRDFGARVSLGENLDLLVSKDSILLKPHYELTASFEEYQGRLEAMTPVAVKMPRAGRSSALTMVPWLNYAVKVEEVEKPGPGLVDQIRLPERSALAALVNLTDLQEVLYIRPRRAFDRLQPLGMVEQVRLKQYLHANKVLFGGARNLLPALNDVLALRLWPVLADSQEVLWVPGFGLSEKIKAGHKASHLITLVPLTHDLSGAGASEASNEGSGGFDDGTC